MGVPILTVIEFFLFRIPILLPLCIILHFCLLFPFSIIAILMLDLYYACRAIWSNPTHGPKIKFLQSLWVFIVMMPIIWLLEILYYFAVAAALVLRGLFYSKDPCDFGDLKYAIREDVKQLLNQVCSRSDWIAKAFSVRKLEPGTGPADLSWVQLLLIPAACALVVVLTPFMNLYVHAPLVPHALKRLWGIYTNACGPCYRRRGKITRCCLLPFMVISAVLFFAACFIVALVAELLVLPVIIAVLTVRAVVILDSIWLGIKYSPYALSIVDYILRKAVSLDLIQDENMLYYRLCPEQLPTDLLRFGNRPLTAAAMEKVLVKNVRRWRLLQTMVGFKNDPEKERDLRMRRAFTHVF